jgi:uncharacterized protein (TIGR00730 family)
MPPNSPKAPPSICVFCGSARGEDPVYSTAARRFGHLIVENGLRLVFGGGRVGLMGEIASAVAERDGEILGILPGFLRHLEPPMREATKIEITATLNERKTRMFEVSDGFAVLPGGLGTLDEFFEAFTAAQLGQHVKPIVLINTKNYFDPLLGSIDHFVTEGFVKPANKTLIQAVGTPEEAINIFVAAAKRR